MSSKLLLNRTFYLYIAAPLILTGAGLLFMHGQYPPGILLLLSGIYLLINAYRIFNRTNRDIAFFFHAVRNNDTALHFSNQTGIKSLDQLHESMNLLNTHLQHLKLNNEYREQYYSTLIREVNTGLAVLREDDSIELINDTACRYAGISADSTNPDFLRIKNDAFYRQLCRVQPGETITYRNNIESTFHLLLFRASAWKGEKQVLKIVSVQDISHEIDSAEIESYQRLISILTHEIMNAMAPLLSVSRSLQNLNKEDPAASAISKDESEKATLRGLKIIEDQSNGLLNFVNNYRKLTRIPAPEILPFDPLEWMEQVAILFSEKLSLTHVHFEYSVEAQLQEISADRKLLNQVLTNILINGIDALQASELPRIIQLRVLRVVNGRTQIRIHNNGPDIPPELQDKIFVPFFTTKENGSGIGLSLSRQIMILHKGSLSLYTKPGEGVTFVMEW